MQKHWPESHKSGRKTVLKLIQITKPHKAQSADKVLCNSIVGNYAKRFCYQKNFYPFALE